MGYQNYEDETVDSRGILIARINHIANGLSLPALMEVVQEMKAIEAWQHRPRTETTPPLAEAIRGKLTHAVIRPPIVLEAEEGDRNPRESELADSIRDYFSNGTL
jgi:rhamnogalacturonyl hydrolase YesR